MDVNLKKITVERGIFTQILNDLLQVKTYPLMEAKIQDFIKKIAIY